jgi:DNA-binding NarL/FixJ family response regulator
VIRVLLVDDHRLLRQGTRALLTEDPDIEVVAETDRGEEGIALASRVSPDIVLLDIRLHGLNGIEVARILRHDLPEIKVIILTAYPQEQYVRALFAIGVHGYLLKDASGAELISSLRRVMQGEQVLSPEISAQARGASLRTPDRLTDREIEVLTLVGQGHSNKHIAEVLGVNSRTVETHVSRLMAKLDARSRTEAINTARHRGILSVEVR